MPNATVIPHHLSSCKVKILAQDEIAPLVERHDQV